MSQRAFLATMDAALHTAFAGAGLADVALYTPRDAAPDALPLGCQVFVDRDMQRLGDTRQFRGGRVEVGYVLGSMLLPPAKGGRLVVDGEIYLNDEELANDGSVSQWVVRRG